jgi:hypothetical protein
MTSVFLTESLLKPRNSLGIPGKSSPLPGKADEGSEKGSGEA